MVLLEKLVVTQPAKKLHFMKQVTLQCSREFAINFCHKSDESCPQPGILFI
jgi:hypothetical protein